MSDEEKVAVIQGCSSATPATSVSDLLNFSEALSLSSNMDSPQALLTQQSGVLHGSIAILWDIENCPVPSDVRPEDVAGNIRMALRVHPIIRGAVTMFSAYGDFNNFPRKLREGCQRTGVKLVDVPNGRKDAADKAILIDMFLFALDNRPPSSILLISGDVDFAPALHILGQRGYTIILVIPAGVGVSSALSNAGQFLWDWPSMARGDGFIPPKTFVPRGYGLCSYLMGCNIGDNEEEAIVYKGITQNEHFYCYNSSNVSRELSSSVSDYNASSLAFGPFFGSSRCQSLSLGFTESQSNTQDPTSWVQPGDLQGLKGQLVRLLKMFGGILQLVRVPAEYLKQYGRPLYMSEYGADKLVNLVRKMPDALTVVGKGQKKLLSLRDPIKKCPSTPTILSKNPKGKRAIVESSSDENSDEEKGTYDLYDRLEDFRAEVQEMLVCYSGPIPLGRFEALYEQRYKKHLDYLAFGAHGLEGLFEKVREVVELHEDQGSQNKFLVSSCFGG